MFDLVEDVASYPQFLHWCRGATVRPVAEGVIDATLDIGLRGIHKRFTTRNSSERPQRIRLELIEGPFRSLQGEWAFEELPDGGARVSLLLDFQMRASPLNRLFSLVFEELIHTQMKAFTERADELYGRSG